MTKLFVMGGYLYQSIAAIGLVFAVSHLVDSASYTVFSLVFALSQFIAVLAFEWLQIAGTRFLAGADAGEKTRLRSAVFSAFGLSAVALLAAAPVAFHFTAARPLTAALALGVAIAQSLADLLLTMLRVDNRLVPSAGLAIFRASCLVTLATLGAWLHPFAEGALAGMLLAQLCGIAAVGLYDRRLVRWNWRETHRSDLLAYCRYGMRAAAASVMHLAASVSMRFLIVGRLGPSSADAAGFSLAFDLLQRPFSVLVAAVHMVSFPEVAAKYDRASPEEAKAATARLFEFLLCSTALLMAGMIAFTADVAWLVVPAPTLPAFLLVAPAVTFLAFVNTHLQVTGAVVIHLQKRTERLVLVALGQLLVTVPSCWLVLAQGGSAATAIGVASGATLLWGFAMAAPTIRFGAIPDLGLVAACGAAAAAVFSLGWISPDPWPLFAAKIAAAGALTFFVLWRGRFLHPAERQP
jgi:O-antigen/teichoic acid export membrane protein